MIIFLYGDGHRVGQEASSIEDRYNKKYPNGVNFLVFDLLQDDAGKLEDAIKTASFFNEVKLITIRNAFSHKKDPGYIQELIKNYDLKNDKLTVLLFRESLSEKELKTKDSKLFSILADKTNLIRNFEKLDGTKLEAWVKKEFAARDCSISAVLARKLIQITGSDTNRLEVEINKLSNYKLKGEVADTDMDRLVSREVELNIFNLLDAIASGNKVTALDLLYKEIQTGRDPYYLLTMFLYQLRNMLTIKDLADRGASSPEIAKRSKLHPFVIKKSLNTLSRLSLQEIKSKFGVLSLLDLNAKEGKVDLVDSLYSFVLA